MLFGYQAADEVTKPFAALREAHAKRVLVASGLMAVALAFNGLRWWIVMGALLQ